MWRAVRRLMKGELMSVALTFLSFSYRFLSKRITTKAFRKCLECAAQLLGKQHQSSHRKYCRLKWQLEALVITVRVWLFYNVPPFCRETAARHLDVPLRRVWPEDIGNTLKSTSQWLLGRTFQSYGQSMGSTGGWRSSLWGIQYRRIATCSLWKVASPRFVFVFQRLMGNRRVRDRAFARLTPGHIQEPILFWTSEPVSGTWWSYQRTRAPWQQPSLRRKTLLRRWCSPSY